jgi:alpha-1,6-mannosyltransferase
LVLYAGRLAPEKNLGLVLETMAILFRDSKRDYRLIVPGSGALKESFRELGQELGVAAVFLGHVEDRQRLADLYANSDVFVHPNPREPSGIAPLEAMASGLPLIAPVTGGLRAYADFDNEWLVPPEPPAFAAAVRAAATIDSVRTARIAAPRTAAERFVWSAAICAARLTSAATALSVSETAPAPCNFARARARSMTTTGEPVRVARAS